MQLNNNWPDGLEICQDNGQRTQRVASCGVHELMHAFSLTNTGNILLNKTFQESKPTYIAIHAYILAKIIQPFLG